MEGASAVASERQEVFAGVKDRLDALADRREVWAGAGFVFASWTGDRGVQDGGRRRQFRNLPRLNALLKLVLLDLRGEADEGEWARILRENHPPHQGKPPPRRLVDGQLIRPSESAGLRCLTGRYACLHLDGPVWMADTLAHLTSVELSNRGDEELSFDSLDALAQRANIIVRQYWNRPFRDDRPAVVLLIDEVNRRRGGRHTGLKHCFVDVLAEHPLATESGQRRRVRVDEPTREGSQGPRSRLTQVASQHDQVHPAAGQQVVHRRVTCSGPDKPLIEHDPLDAQAVGQLCRWHVPPADDEQDDLGRHLAAAASLNERLKGAPFSRGEDSDPRR